MRAETEELEHRVLAWHSHLHSETRKHRSLGELACILKGFYSSDSTVGIDFISHLHNRGLPYRSIFHHHLIAVLCGLDSK